MKKRFLNLLLVMLLVVCALPLAASAAESTECTDHDWQFKGRVEATCTEDGWKGGDVCKICGKARKETNIIPKLGHDLSDGMISYKAPTCQEVGKATYKCKTCKEQVVKDIAKLNCNIVETEAKAPTCTEKGKTAGVKCTTCREGVTTCSYCEEHMVPQQYIDALGHDYSKNLGYREGDEPTCEATGITVLQCTRCGGTTAQTAPALGHKEVVNPGYAATCTKEGRTDGKICSVCEKPLKSQYKIAPLGHDYSKFVRYKEGKEATCLTGGLAVMQCSRCEETTVQEVPALNHDWDIKVLKEATCTVKGMEFHQCKREGCGVYKYVVIAALGHKKVVVDAVEPTCTATGLTEGKKCATCGAILVGQTVTDKIAHSFTVDVAAQEATCTANGYTAHKKCSGDGCTATEGKEVIYSTGHNFVNYVCTECGARDGSCPHEGATVETIDATCTADGKESFHCGVCGDAYENVLPKLGHSYSDGVCIRCGEIDPASIPCSHGDTTSTTTEPTCSRSGSTVVTCNSCGEVINRTTIPATGNHTYVNNRCTGCGKLDPNRITADYQDVYIVG